MCRIIGKMKTKMENFDNDCSQNSDMCKYVLQGLQLINLVEMLAMLVEQLMPVFLEFDSINYLIYASWYLKRIKVPESKNPYFYKTFMHKHFVVKDKQRKFNRVSPEMKLEQIMQRAIKDPDGIIGEQ